MSKRGIAEIRYTQQIPPSGVGIARVSSTLTSAADLSDINSTPYSQGLLGVWQQASVSSTPDWPAYKLGQSIQIQGATTYRVANQFFEVTNIFSGSVPLYYKHVMKTPARDVLITDLDGVAAVGFWKTINNVLYHDLAEQVYRVRYVDDFGFSHSEMLLSELVLAPTDYSPSTSTYVLNSGFLTVDTTATLGVRFTKQNGLQVSFPYRDLPNIPWYPIITLPIVPGIPEWATQVFQPRRGYVFSSWVFGTVVAEDIIEFERKDVLFDGLQVPDILVFDRDFRIKYALDGSAPGSPPRKGTEYPWHRGLIHAWDSHSARFQVDVSLASDDKVFAFYYHRQPNLIYRDLDVNPATNPVVKNRIMRFYYKTGGSNVFKTIYHRVEEEDGTLVSTNDPDSPSNPANVFSTVAVGPAVHPDRFTIEDVRVRGGGIEDQYRDLPLVRDFWDIGFWDGKPEPVGSSILIHLPVSILNRMGRDEVVAKLEAILPMGILPVIRYYDPQGNETT